LDELITSTSSVAERVLTAQSELLDVLQRILGPAHEAGKSIAQARAGVEHGFPSAEFTRFMPELSGTTQRLPFNIICRGPQKFCWAEIPLADIKAVKQACDATVNDVVLALVTSAMQRYVERQGVRIRGRLLRIVVPVNVRGNGSAGELGNRITFLPITIPLDIRNVRRLVGAIRKRMAFLKSAHLAELVSVVGTVLGTIPSAA
jgi:diacylglycerol O-acyltransferase